MTFQFKPEQPETGGPQSARKHQTPLASGSDTYQPTHEATSIAFNTTAQLDDLRAQLLAGAQPLAGM
ncbi:hypothetical protein MMEU_2813 [Mycobacterium marinum str. Europe]|nr:hypothetical protein MMEU_2813 [Mycobacterium marinum str. Europe]